MPRTLERSRVLPAWRKRPDMADSVLTPDHAPEVVRPILAADPIWAAYAIADLQPEMAADCCWLARADAAGEAVALIYSGLEPPVLFTMGEPLLLAALLGEGGLPSVVYASIREEHLPAVTRYYDLSSDTRPMWRMVLADAQAALGGTSGSAHEGAAVPARLTGAQVPDVLRLLANGGPFCPDAFSAAQVEQGVFFGVYDGPSGSDLMAVGGTHIVDRTEGIAAIGSMYTRPDRRRCGHSAAVLGAIVRELLRLDVHTIVLNVDQRNASAQALYRQHGFVVHTSYIEGKGHRHA